MASRPRADGPNGALVLPGTVSLAARLSLPRVRVRLGRTAAALALGSLVAAVFALVLVTASGPSLMVARSLRAFPGWESGPLHGWFGAVPPRFGVLIAAVSLVIVVVALHLILLMTP
ncbi:MAG TPA: hypothetical protein VG123_34225, partial [Streptosporangiaceae bacterium]|nr:hypothetical protein [Streptosporangiaceae bacterium]